MAEVAFDPNILQTLWFGIIVLCMVVYYVLDGFDLGVGILYPFIAKDEREKKVMRDIIGPVWDGNEVWLITLGGATFAAFPPVYATTFSGFYVAICLVLFALIVRAIAVSYARAGKFEKFWDAMFFVGSLLVALLAGVAVGNLLNTVPLLPNGDIAGEFPARFVQLLGVFPLICGVFAVAMAVLQGAGIVAAKSGLPELRARAQKVRSGAQIANIVIFVLASIVFFTVAKPNLVEAGGFVDGIPQVLRWAFFAIAVIGLLASIGFGRQGEDLKSFIAGSLFVGFVVAMVGAAMFPTFVPAGDPALTPLVAANEGLTITAAAPFASSDTALKAMTIIAAIGVPLVLIYHVIAYKIFFGRIDHTDLVGH